MSEQAKHTPGPWMICDGGDIASASVRLPEHTVIRGGTVKGATIGEAMANARLIAAAPELLEEVERLYSHLGGGSNWRLHKGWIARLKTLIDKAKLSEATP